MPYVSHSVEETQQLARAISERVQPGDVILLVGDLGAGKTHFTQGFAAGLGIAEVPTSPTFNLVCEYHDGRLPLYHFDLYRLEEPEELEDIDYYGITEGDGVSLVDSKRPHSTTALCSISRCLKMARARFTHILRASVPASWPTVCFSFLKL